jgi:asparagine synthase (glutamine-hydrolysing)
MPATRAAEKAMPGIAGIATNVLPRELAVAQLRRMLGVLRHESFYVCGSWFDERAGIYLGWTAIDNAAGCMPFRNEQGDRILVFSGEEFPEPGTPQALRSRGHEFDQSGFSYLVHVAEEDPSFPVSLDGRFHGLLVNRESGGALLFNDRYGMHRVYCHESAEAFYFAAEAKAILAAVPNLGTLDAQGLGDFISCGAVLESRTLFKDIFVLPPASAWVFQNGALKRKAFYFSPTLWQEQAPLDSASYYRELRDVFARNVPRYFSGSAPVAMSLTGGLDTRMIMAWQKMEPATLPCYTFGGMRRDCQDVIVARQVARACRQTHEVIPVTQDFLSNFSQYAERAVYLTDGCVDVSRATDLYLNRRARQVAPVRITGNYGGEILRHVQTFKAEEPQGDVFCPEVLSYARKTRETLASNTEEHPVAFAAFRQAPWAQYGILSLEQAQLTVRSPFLANELVRTAFRAPPSCLNTNDVSLRLISDGNPQLGLIPTDLGLGGGRRPIVEAASHAWQTFFFKAEYAYDRGMPEWAVRIDRSLSGLKLDRQFLGRHKFAHFRVWYREDLSGYLQETLLSQRSLSRPYLDEKAVRRALTDHLRGKRNLTTLIHKLLTLEIAHRLFVDKSGAQPPDPVAGSV